MQLKEVVGIIQDPVIIYRGNNLGNLSTFRDALLRTALNCKIERIEGVGTNKQIAIYITD